MDIKITPKKLSGTVRAKSSKSHAHRLLICSYLAGEELSLEGIDISADIAATLDCLNSMKDGGVLDCSESGSTLRFLLPVACALGVNVRFEGHGKLPERPLHPLTDELIRGGAVLSSDSLPITVGGQLKSGDYTLPGNISSQFISGMLFALPLLEGDSRLHITGKTESAAYIELTLDALRAFSVDIKKTEDGYFIRGSQKYTAPKGNVVQGDWSNAAFFLCMGALGGDITVSNLDINCSQSDRAIFELLKSFNADISQSENGVFSSKGRKLSPQKIDVSPCPDLFPVLSVTACGAVGDTLLYNAARLRIKESDRIEATAELIRGLGGKVTVGEDSLTVHGTGRLSGGEIDSFNDHRIVMSAAVAASICDNPVVIRNAQAVNKSYPKFFEDYKSVGGDADVC